jgi:hypothetical protein
VRDSSLEVCLMAPAVKPAPTAAPPSDLLPLAAAAVLLQDIAPDVPLWSFYRLPWQARHGVPTVKLGRFTFYPRTELTAWAKAWAKTKR